MCVLCVLCVFQPRFRLETITRPDVSTKIREHSLREYVPFSSLLFRIFAKCENDVPCIRVRRLAVLLQVRNKNVPNTQQNPSHFHRGHLHILPYPIFHVEIFDFRSRKTLRLSKHDTVSNRAPSNFF